MKLGIIISIIIFALGLLMTILQLWFSLFSKEVFLNSIITLVLLFVFVLVVTLILRDYFEEKQQKQDKFLR